MSSGLFEGKSEIYWKFVWQDPYSLSSSLRIVPGLQANAITAFAGGYIAVNPCKTPFRSSAAGLFTWTPSITMTTCIYVESKKEKKKHIGKY